MITEIKNARLIAICSCGQKVHSFNEQGTFGLIHEEPICEPFERMEPLEFVTWLRKKKGLPSPHPKDWNKNA